MLAQFLSFHKERCTGFRGCERTVQHCYVVVCMWAAERRLCGEVTFCFDEVQTWILARQYVTTDLTIRKKSSSFTVCAHCFLRGVVWCGWPPFSAGEEATSVCVLLTVAPATVRTGGNSSPHLFLCVYHPMYGNKCGSCIQTSCLHTAYLASSSRGSC